MKLKRCSENPILKPSKIWWEKKEIFNAAVCYHEGVVHMLYRAIGERDKYISRIGYASSKDGIHFKRLKNPVFKPTQKGKFEGTYEDPRITRIGNKFYVTYAVINYPPNLGRGRPNPTRTALAVTKDFRHFKKLGIITPEKTDNRDAFLFPEKINNKYVMIHRPLEWKYENKQCMWISFSKDLLHWKGHKLLMQPKFSWESRKIGGGAPPIKTERGWLEFYHGVSKDNVYSLGAVIYDLKNPLKIVARTKEPILTPQKSYEMIKEKQGTRNKYVFTCGAIEKDDKFYVYYGAADKTMCLATCKKDEIYSF